MDSTAGRDRAAGVLRRFFAGDADGGLFQPRPVSVDAQDTLLGSLDARLDLSGRAACDAPVTEEELLAALTAAAHGKRPGCDGLPYEFYRQFWNQVGGELALVLEEAFSSEEDVALSPLQREGRIVMLFKGGPRPLRERAEAYRPITLQNVDVKMLAMALAKRWGPHLVEVVDVTQTGFLPGRFIGDNILAHLEEVDFLEATQQPAAWSSWTSPRPTIAWTAAGCVAVWVRWVSELVPVDGWMCCLVGVWHVSPLMDGARMPSRYFVLGFVPF